MNEDLVAAITALGHPPPEGSPSVTSDLSVDESLLLHSFAWEPTDLASGVSVQSVPFTIWNPIVGQAEPSELSVASQGMTEAFAGAAEQLRHDCAQSGGHGVVGVEVELEIERTAIRVSLTGTAVRPIGKGASKLGRPFVTDLSTKDFVLLNRAGWTAVELAFGAAFVIAPYQRIRQFLAQVSQNIELVNLTQALQTARERAMERMQQRALQDSGTGVVDVKILDGPITHSSHVLAFVCYGTSVRLAGESHQRIEPQLVLPLDDHLADFEATSLRNRR